jgi:hypothetical protein
MSLDDKRNYLLSMLSIGECVVEFTKVNGEHRVMPCTLSAQIIPPAPVRESTEKKERKVNTDVLRVFVTDINEWRSFRIDSVISIT